MAAGGGAGAVRADRARATGVRRVAVAKDITLQNARWITRVVHPTLEELLPTPEARKRFKETAAARRQPEPPPLLDDGRYDKRWKEGYKAGTINTPLPDHYTPLYLAGYAEGLIEHNRLMSLDDIQPERPPEFGKWEAYFMSQDCKARCILRREDMRALLRYVRRLERDVAEESFW